MGNIVIVIRPVIEVQCLLITILLNILSNLYAMELSGKISSGRRDEITIMTDLMANMFQPMRSTHLLYRTNLSYSQLKKYLTSLLDMGLVEETARPYRAFSITEKGRTFMDLVGADVESPRRFWTTATTARS